MKTGERDGGREREIGREQRGRGEGEPKKCKEGEGERVSGRRRGPSYLCYHRAILEALRAYRALVPETSQTVGETQYQLIIDACVVIAIFTAIFAFFGGRTHFLLKRTRLLAKWRDVAFRVLAVSVLGSHGTAHRSYTNGR